MVSEHDDDRKNLIQSLPAMMIYFDEYDDDDDDGDDDDIFDRQGHQMERMSHFCPRCFVALSITLTIPAWLQAEKTTRP